MAEDAQRFDVLVVGSGASGLASAVSADRSGARVALATKGSLQANNSSKAQGGIQASFGADDSSEQHAADIWKSSHETSDQALVDVLTGDARSAISRFRRPSFRASPRPLPSARATTQTRGPPRRPRSS